MNAKQLEQQSKEAVIAYLQGRSVRVEYRYKDGNTWNEVTSPLFDLTHRYYRIAQPKPWYRVALMAFGTKSVDDENIESYLETNDCFIKWLTERIEYEIHF